ncbi:hypothetical protein HS088_TW04G01493 [Tripterygium wilfordii]|uniref:BHLH domain-containing protein n=1 Tax=Tripterygium wilfordii TaxID=458696 RepID=A0A7J7DTP9_TRIWF|nr:bHLH transcription factor RHL1-like [Tripterygium wilfordii]KAF5749524.1 hypothetical protein HS088_TW04G01493 [Tripterygium wilfordii]
MQPCSREMQATNSLMIQSLQDQQTSQNPHFDPASSSHDDFLDQMLSSIPSCSWTDLKSPWDLTTNGNGVRATTADETAHENVGFHFDESAILASKLRQHQISGGGSSSVTAAAAKMMLQQQQQMLMSATMPLSIGNGNDVVDGFNSPTSQGGDGTIQALFNGFTGSLNGSGQAPNQGQQHFHHPQGGTMQAQNYGVPGSVPVMNQSPAPAQQTGQASGSTGGQPGQPRQRVRARRGQATDPHSIAERLRRERIAERMKSLQELVPNANKTDKASMLDEIIDYVKFLQLQVKVLSMSRLGGAAAVAPLVADLSTEAGDCCIQAGANGGSLGRTSNGNGSSNDSLTVTEHQVAKLMDEDMGSAMQYLQGKGLCLMPISLATAISTATCRTRNPLLQSNGEGPSSPSMSVLTVQSATIGNGGGGDVSVKDAASVSKP